MGNDGHFQRAQYTEITSFQSLGKGDGGISPDKPPSPSSGATTRRNQMTKFLIVLILAQGWIIYERFDHTHTREEVKQYILTAHEMGREDVILEALND